MKYLPRRKSVQEKESMLVVRCELKISSLGIIIIAIIIIITLFQEDNIFGTNVSLTYGPQIQRHTCV